MDKISIGCNWEHNGKTNESILSALISSIPPPLFLNLLKQFPWKKYQVTLTLYPINNTSAQKNMYCWYVSNKCIHQTFCFEVQNINDMHYIIYYVLDRINFLLYIVQWYLHLCTSTTAVLCFLPPRLIETLGRW